MKVFVTFLAALMTAAIGFTSCSDDSDASIVLEKTSWEGQVTSTNGDTETTIRYQATFTGKNEGLELQHFTRKEGGRTVVDYKVYSSFTYDFNGRSGSIHYTSAIVENAGIVYAKSQFPDVNMAWYGDQKILKAYTNMPCSQVAYSPIRIPDQTIPGDSEFQEVQGGNMQQAFGQWTCQSPNAYLELNLQGKSSYTVGGKVLAEGEARISGPGILIDGKLIYVVYVDARNMYITDFAGNILLFNRK